MIAISIAIPACGRIDNEINNFKSTVGMLDRTVTLYAADGRVIKTWQTRNQIEYQGPVVAFVDRTNTNVRVSGTIVIEGK